MTDVYKNCPVLENERYLLRFVKEEDTDDLLEVYSDKNALPFFNSDNCGGDNFYYPTRERMLEAVRYWISSYEKGWFVRFTIIDKAAAKAIGTVELFLRESDDAFDGDGVLRLDVRNDREREDILLDILSLAVPPAFDMFGCGEIITKAPIYAVERIAALAKFGFEKSEHLMTGTHDRLPYNGYWTVKRA